MLWNDYDLQKKDLTIESFHSDSLTFSANIFYTTDVTTKLIDSQIQPTSTLGMSIFTFQSITAFLLLTGLITILINKFVK